MCVNITAVELTTTSLSRLSPSRPCFIEMTDPSPPRGARAQEILVERPDGGAIGGDTLSFRLATALRERIVRGEINAGERLRQDDIARQFGVSHGSVR